MLNQDETPRDFLRNIPNDLPVPVDDGACNHLEGLMLPTVNLPSTNGGTVNPSQVPGWLVIYCYPMTGQPGRAIPDGWIQIPGAAGCTPQSCSFRDYYRELKALNTNVFGISTQSTEEQLEAVERLHLPFDLLSDASFQFSQGLRLPMFEVEGMRLTKRVTLIAKDGNIQKYFYPVFPPDKNIDEVLAWLVKGGTGVI
ncbi:peroxiredoxin [Methylobacter sp. G7]|uniref:peroxiredoxin n=1 Tax=Methylobacter sp. G7 TaxID=3230117 RepID=UPI003D8065BF